MKTWKPVYRWLVASTGFMVAVAVGVVVLGPSGDDVPDRPNAVRTPVTSSAPTADEPDALVNRMLDQLRNGETVEPQFAPGEGNPAAGVPIEAIKARPGEQLRLGRLAIPG